MQDIQTLLADYRKGAAGTGDDNPEQANKWYGKLRASYGALRETHEGRSAILSLLHDEDPHVRCWAAAHSLQWSPEVARRALEHIRDSKGRCSFDAAVTLREFDKGTLTFGD